MRKKVIWGNTLIKNEDRYIWFAVMGVINHLDKMLIWDSGSSDNTRKIIEQLQRQHPDKITLKYLQVDGRKDLSQARQDMLRESHCDWILLLDGDEIWWNKSISMVIDAIQRDGDNLNALFVPVYNLVGDIYHYQSQLAGRYQVLGRRGHFNLRAINKKIPGLQVGGEYPLEGYRDKSNYLIQDGKRDRLRIIDAPLLHFTHLPRSSVESASKLTLNRSNKVKHEMGISFSKNFRYPEVLYLARPDNVPSPWIRMSLAFKLRSLLETPMRLLKRLISSRA